MGDRFVGRINADAARSGATPDVFFRLIFFVVEIADTRQSFTEIANLVRLDTAAFLQQRLTKRLPVVPVGGRQSDARDDNPLFVGKLRCQIGCDHVLFNQEW